MTIFLQILTTIFATQGAHHDLKISHNYYGRTVTNNFVCFEGYLGILAFPFIQKLVYIFISSTSFSIVDDLLRKFGT